MRAGPSALTRTGAAGIDRYDTAIVLADETATSATDGERDASSLLTCLAVESLNPGCYTCLWVPGARIARLPTIIRAIALRVIPRPRIR